MSYDFYIFSKRHQRITRDQLVTALSKCGFEAELYEEVRPPKLIVENVTESCTVLGWRQQTIDRDTLDKVHSSGTSVDWDKLFIDNVLGYCNITVTSIQEFLKNFDDDYFESVNNQVNPDAIAAAKSATTVYEISTSAGRSQFSVSFQLKVCKVVAELSKGIIEDPQEGYFFEPAEADQYFGTEPPPVSD